MEGGFAAAHGGKPVAYRADYSISLEAPPQSRRHSLMNSLMSLSGKAKPFRPVLRQSRPLLRFSLSPWERVGVRAYGLPC
jgi:hypothetical protein